MSLRAPWVRPILTPGSAALAKPARFRKRFPNACRATPLRRGIHREGRVLMIMRTRHVPTILVMALVIGGITRPASGDAVSDGQKVGHWKTWVLTSSSEIPVGPPPAETSEQTRTELAELRQLQKERSPS